MDAPQRVLAVSDGQVLQPERTELRREMLADLGATGGRGRRFEVVLGLALDPVSARSANVTHTSRTLSLLCRADVAMAPSGGRKPSFVARRRVPER
jgi:hypothetical protein